MADGRPVAAMILSVIGDLLILVAGIFYILVASAIGGLGLGDIPELDTLEATLGIDLETILLTIGVIGVVLGALVLVLGIVMYMKPGSSTALGIIILILSLISIIATGGFFIGLVLGLVGGILGIVFKPAPAVPTYDTSQMQPPPPSQ